MTAEQREQARDRGRSFGPLFWRYDLVAGAAFSEMCGYGLRWYGIAIPRTNIGIGVMVRRKNQSGAA